MSNSNQVIIEDNVPEPETLPPLPLEDMKIGQSFVVTIKNETQRTTLMQRIYRFKKENPPANFTSRKVGAQEYRVWRIANLGVDDEGHE